MIAPEAVFVPEDEPEEEMPKKKGKKEPEANGDVEESKQAKVANPSA